MQERGVLGFQSFLDPKLKIGKQPLDLAFAALAVVVAALPVVGCQSKADTGGGDERLPETRQWKFGDDVHLLRGKGAALKQPIERAAVDQGHEEGEAARHLEHIGDNSLNISEAVGELA